MLTSTPTPAFQDLFFARSMHQTFNRAGAHFESDEAEPAVRKWLKASGQLN
ncbi:MAG: hypothetical protein ACK4NR_11840 [Micavibrio sp.]